MEGRIELCLSLFLLFWCQFLLPFMPIILIAIAVAGVVNQSIHEAKDENTHTHSFLSIALLLSLLPLNTVYISLYPQVQLRKMKKKSVEHSCSLEFPPWIQFHFYLLLPFIFSHHLSPNSLSFFLLSFTGFPCWFLLYFFVSFAKTKGNRAIDEERKCINFPFARSLYTLPLQVILFWFVTLAHTPNTHKCNVALHNYTCCVAVLFAVSPFIFFHFSPVHLRLHTYLCFFCLFFFSYQLSFVPRHSFNAWLPYALSSLAVVWFGLVWSSFFSFYFTSSRPCNSNRQFKTPTTCRQRLVQLHFTCTKNTQRP